MNKQEFLAALRSHLNDLSPEDIRRSLDFYGEMIDDRMEEGLSEEEAVAAVGDAAQIADQIRTDAGAAPRKTHRKFPAWGWVLILLGFPLWLPLLIGAAAIIFSLFVSLWSVVISLYAVAVSLAVSSVVALVVPLLYLPSGNVSGAILILGGALVLAGITVLLFIGLKPVTKGIAWLTKKLFVWLKSLFVRKEAVQ